MLVGKHRGGALFIATAVSRFSSHNNVLELTRLSRLKFEVGLDFVGSLPAKALLQTRLAAQHNR